MFEVIRDHKQLIPEGRQFPVFRILRVLCPNPGFFLHLFAGSSILTCTVGPDWGAKVY